MDPISVSVRRGPFVESVHLVHAVAVRDGKVVAEGKLPAFIRRDPADSMQIGADEGSSVLGDKRPPRFTGLIESVKLFSGEAK